MTPDTEWWPTLDPAVHLSTMLRNINWRGLRGGYEQLHPELAATIRESALWMIEGLVDNPVYGVGSTIDDLGLLDVGRAVLLWLEDPGDPGLIDHLGAVCRVCAALGDLLDDPPL